MTKLRTLADYYLDKVPLVAAGGSLRSGGHFAVWHLEDFATDEELINGYSRKNFYQIVLTRNGDATYHYADQHQVLAAPRPSEQSSALPLPYPRPSPGSFARWPGAHWRDAA